MAETRAQRGLPVPTVGQIVVIAAALIAAWLIWTNYGRFFVEPALEVAGGRFASLHAVETWLQREADPVPVLLPALDSQNPKERQWAAYGLGRIGPPAGPALDKLRERLADENPDVRAKAVFAISQINPDQESVAANLAPLLADSDDSVRANAGTALFEIGPHAVKPLLAMLHSDQTVARLEAVRWLRKLQNQHKSGDMGQQVIDAVGDVLRDPDPEVRIEAVMAAAEWGIASPQQVRKLLHDPARAWNGLSAIGKLGDDAAQLLPDVIAMLDDETPLAFAPNMRDPHMTRDRLQAVLNALSSMKTGASPATGRLVEISSKHHDYTCISIATTLHAIGAEEDVVASVLTPLLLDQNLSWSAGQLLAKSCPGEARRQVSLLLPKLGTNETSVAKDVLFALYALGPQAQDAVPAVVPLLQNPDPWVAKFAAQMLRETGTGSADIVANLAQVAGNNSLPDESRLACVNALAGIGPAAQSVVPAFLKFVGEPEPAVSSPATSITSKKQPQAASKAKERAASRKNLRAAIIRALGRIGGDDEGMIPVLRSQLVSSSADVRAAAADALGRVAGQSAEALGDVVGGLRDEDAGVRAMAALAVGGLATGRTPAEQKDAVALLIDALADENLYVRQAAAIALGKIGPAAKSALPALRELQVEPATPGTSPGAGSQRPDSLQQFLEMNGLNGIGIQQTAKTAIDQIERGPHNE